MHSLLKRQLRKNIPAHLKDDAALEDFFNAIEKSYENYDEKLSMLQRATSISSEELFLANSELTKEAKRQQQILNSLDRAIVSLNSNLDNQISLEDSDKSNFDAEKLAKHISELAVKVTEITAEKSVLLKDLEEQNESLNNYIKMVSHDLKSPIRNINALMSWILEEEKGNFSAESKKNCSMVSDNLTKMDNLINGILQHATIGAQMESKAKIEVSDLLKEIEKNVSIPSNISFEYSEKLPEIFIERYWVEQLFTILLNNAIAATVHLSAGKIWIGYEEDAEFWKFSISDNGIGIPLKHQVSIFEMFHKLDNNTNSAGVGLALAKKIVLLYNGDISLTSEEGKGTTFYFTLKKE